MRGPTYRGYSPKVSCARLVGLGPCFECKNPAAGGCANCDRPVCFYCFGHNTDDDSGEMDQIWCIDCTTGTGSSRWGIGGARKAEGAGGGSAGGGGGWRPETRSASAAMPPPSHSPRGVLGARAAQSVDGGGGGGGLAKRAKAPPALPKQEDESPKTAKILELQRRLEEIQGRLGPGGPPSMPPLASAAEQVGAVALRLGTLASRGEVASSQPRFRKVEIKGGRSDQRNMPLVPGEKLHIIIGAGNGEHVPLALRGLDRVESNGAMGGLFTCVNAREALEATKHFPMGSKCHRGADGRGLH